MLKARNLDSKEIRPTQKNFDGQQKQNLEGGQQSGRQSRDTDPKHGKTHFTGEHKNRQQRDVQKTGHFDGQQKQNLEGTQQSGRQQRDTSKTGQHFTEERKNVEGSQSRQQRDVQKNRT